MIIIWVSRICIYIYIFVFKNNIFECTFFTSDSNWLITFHIYTHVHDLQQRHLQLFASLSSLCTFIIWKNITSHPKITFWRYLRGIAWAGTPVLRCSVVRLGKAGYLRMGLSSAMLSKQTWVPVFSGLFWRPCDSLRETPGTKFMVSSLKLPEIIRVVG